MIDSRVLQRQSRAPDGGGSSVYFTALRFLLWKKRKGDGNTVIQQCAGSPTSNHLLFVSSFLSHEPGSTAHFSLPHTQMHTMFLKGGGFAHGCLKGFTAIYFNKSKS